MWSSRLSCSPGRCRRGARGEVAPAIRFEHGKVHAGVELAQALDVRGGSARIVEAIASETVGSGITRDVGYGFEVPNDDVVGHVVCLPYRREYKLIFEKQLYGNVSTISQICLRNCICRGSVRSRSQSGIFVTKSDGSSSRASNFAEELRSDGFPLAPFESEKPLRLRQKFLRSSNCGWLSKLGLICLIAGRVVCRVLQDQSRNQRIRISLPARLLGSVRLRTELQDDGIAKRTRIC